MPDFTYIARDGNGQRVSGTVDAATRNEVISLLASRSLYPVEVTTRSAVVRGAKVRRVSGQVLATTYAQLADLLRSGVPLLRSLEVIRKQTSHKGLTDVLSQVNHQVEGGATLAEAMARFPTVFGEMAISMVRAGGEGGFLEESLKRVADFTEAQEDLKKRVMGAMIYPAVLGVFGTLVVVALLVFFVPRFEGIFQNLRERGELPAMTEGLLTTSKVLQRTGPLFLVPLAVAVWLVRRWLRSDKGRWWLDRNKLAMPLVGGLFQSLAVARFCRVLGTLLHNGVPIIRSLDISSDATGNRVLGQAIHEATDNISAGQRLAEPLGASGTFPPAVVEMIAVAEESNTLENVLVDIAESLERRTWRQLDVAVRLLEPLMLILLAGVVLVLVVGLLLPVVKMSTTI